MKQKIRCALNIAIALAVLTVWISLFKNAEGFLESPGLRSLKYYTVLSNFLEALTSIIWLIAFFSKRPLKIPDRFKFFSTVAIGVTFTVVAAFLGPIYGYKRLYEGSNLWYHLLVPLSGLLEFVIFNETKMRIKDAFLSTISVWVYGLIYILNNIINGTGTWPDTNDWYGFLNWGWGVGILIFFAVALIALFAGLLIMLLLKIKNRGKTNE